MKKREDKDLMVRAIEWAIQDRRGLLDAYMGCEDRKSAKEILDDIKALKRLRLKLTGYDKSEMERFLAQFPVVSVFDIKHMKPNPDAG